jgi:hypothetical protein
MATFALTTSRCGVSRVLVPGRRVHVSAASKEPQTVTARIESHRQAITKMIETARTSRKTAEQKASSDLTNLSKYIRGIAREDAEAVFKEKEVYDSSSVASDAPPAEK